MATNVYGVTEIVGTSPGRGGRGHRSRHRPCQHHSPGLDWFEVTQVAGHIQDGRVAHYQVSMKVGFRLDA